MEFETVRPIISGSIGGILAIYLCRALSRLVPKVVNGKSADSLTREYRWAIRLANGLFLCGLLAGLPVYHFGLMPNNDWRGMALSTGGGGLAAMLALHLAARIGGRPSREAYVAYAVSQKTPTVLIYVITSLFIAAGCAALVSLLINPGL